jgi:hypothetical protein
MKRMLLCALLAMTASAGAESLPEDVMATLPGESSTQGDGLSTGPDRWLVAQVAAETAQLMPRSKPEIAPPKAPRRTAARAHGKSRSRVSGKRYRGSPAFRDYKPAPVKSRFQSDAEQFAKANGCAAPATKMNFAVTGSSETFETFTATCGGGKPMSIRCDAAQCRSL